METYTAYSKISKNALRAYNLENSSPEKVNRVIWFYDCLGIDPGSEDTKDIILIAKCLTIDNLSRDNLLKPCIYSVYNPATKKGWALDLDEETSNT